MALASVPVADALLGSMDEMNPPGGNVTFALDGVPRLENTPLESASGVRGQAVPPTFGVLRHLASVCIKRCHGVSHGIGTSIGVQTYEPRRQLRTAQWSAFNR